MATSYGKNLNISIYGGSHDEIIGIRATGLPKGFVFDLEKLAQFMERRAPGRNSLSTTRKEPDRPEFLSGVSLLEGNKASIRGDELHAIIRNTSQRSSDYSNLEFIPRPSHADYAARMKYGEDVDLRGGGHFSGRLTAPLCIVGGICLQYLEEKGVKIDTAVKTVDGAVENSSYKVAESEAPKMEQKTEKPAYKPVIDHIEEEKPAVKVDDSPKKISRLAGFDYVSDEDAPPIDDSFAPPENQIGFEIDGFFAPSREESKKPLHTEDKTPEQPQKPQQVAAPTAKGSVLRDRVSDARLWGTVLKKLRADKNLMLWVACQDLDTKIEENVLYVLVDGENEYNLLLKPESKAVLKAAVNTFAPYDVVIKRVGGEDTEEDKFLQDAEAVNKMFDGKITVKD